MKWIIPVFETADRTLAFRLPLTLKQSFGLRAGDNFRWRKARGSAAWPITFWRAGKKLFRVETNDLTRPSGYCWSRIGQSNVLLVNTVNDTPRLRLQERRLT